jgi:hypothetical protein
MIRIYVPGSHPRGAATIHHVEIKKKTDFVDTMVLKAFAWFMHQPKSATEID